MFCCTWIFPFSVYAVCWCSVVLVVTFFFVSPMYSVISFFLNSLRSLGPRIRAYSNFMFFVFSVLFGSLLFSLLMFLKYSAAMLVSVPLCPFSVKISFEKSILRWRYFSVHNGYARERKPLNTPSNMWCYI